MKLVEKLITFYQVISSILPSRCRFYPSCSVYAKEIIQSYGLNLNSLWMITKRLLRCQPFCAGGIDPIPQK